MASETLTPDQPVRVPDGTKFTSPQGTRAIKGGIKPNPSSAVPDVSRKPPWLRVKLPSGAQYEEVRSIATRWPKCSTPGLPRGKLRHHRSHTCSCAASASIPSMAFASLHRAGLNDSRWRPAMPHTVFLRFHCSLMRKYVPSLNDACRMRRPTRSPRC